MQAGNLLATSDIVCFSGNVLCHSVDLLVDFVQCYDSNRFQAPSQNCGKRLLASSCLSVRMEHLGSHGADFHEI